MVIGYNNTIRWENRDDVPNFIEADRMDDQAFWNALRTMPPTIVPTR